MMAPPPDTDTVSSMTISGTCGNRTVSSLDELLGFLRSYRDGDFGEFWFGEEEYPVMVMSINRDLAYLHFLPDDMHPGFQAVGNVSSGADVTFKQEGQGNFSMPRAVVVSVEQAYRAAAEFFRTSQLPACIKWTEL
jgi:Immunity protein Imm1